MTLARVPLAILTLLWWASSHAIANAQATVSAGAGVVSELTPDPDSVGDGTPNTASRGVGGSGFAGTFGLTAQASSRIAVGVDITIPQAFEFRSGTARFGAIEGTFRDIIVSGLTKIRVVGPVEAVGGVSIVKEELVATQSPPSFVLPPAPATPVHVSLGLVWGGMVGADVAVPVGRHVVVAPEIRLHLIRRGDYERSELGLGAAVIQSGVAVRVRF